MFTQKITIFGDSVAKGLFLNGTRPEHLKISAARIVEESFCTKIENNSKFGQTLQKVFERGIIEKFSKTMQGENLVVIALGGNDADYDWAEVEKSPNTFHTPRTKLEVFEKMLENSLKILKQNGAQVVVASLCPVDAMAYFENVLAKNFDGQKILEFLQGDIQNIYRHQELFNISAQKVALKNDCIFFDYRSEMLKSNSLKNFLCSDGIHPNEMGQSFIANFAIQKLANHQTNFLDILRGKTECFDAVFLKSVKPHSFAFKQLFSK